MQHQHSLPDTSPRILIPWDGQLSLDQVCALARHIGGQHTTVLLLPTSPMATAVCPQDAHPHSGQVGRAATQHRVEHLDMLVSMDLPHDIRGVAAKHAVDLILVVTRCHASETLDPACLAARLALDSPIPVMVVHVDGDTRAMSRTPFARLVVPLDSSVRATQALPVTAELARRLGLPVRLVMVIDPSQVLPPAYAYDPYATVEMVASLTQGAHWALRQAERRLSQEAIDVSSELLYGPVVSSLEAAIQPGDIMVMTTHGIGDAPRNRPGSVAARMVADVPGPLIIMRGSPPDEVVVRGRGERVRHEPLTRPTA